MCGDLVDLAAGHAPAGGDTPVISSGAPAAAATPGRNDAAAHALAAFARSSHGVRGGRLVWGETGLVDGATVSTWAIVSRKDGSVMAAGATVPLSVAETMPARGAGPAGAVASLDFPAVVRESTYFDHFEMHSEPTGHVAPPGAVNPNRNFVPHFDFHFYGIPEAQVRAIPLLRPPPALPAVPADRLPAGHTQPGFSQLQMGRHSGPAWQLTDPEPLSSVVLAGFLPDASSMHFIEPMITQQVLMEQGDLSLEVPMPRAFDRDTLYPARSEMVFHGGAHHFIYSDFFDTHPATPSAAAQGAPAGTGFLYRPVSAQAGPAGPEDGDEDATADDDAGGLAADVLP